MEQNGKASLLNSNLIHADLLTFMMTASFPIPLRILYQIPKERDKQVDAVLVLKIRYITSLVNRIRSMYDCAELVIF